MIDQKPFFELPVRSKKETCERIFDVSKNINEISTGNLLSYDHFLNHYKLILIILPQQDISLDKQEINFIGKLSENATAFFIIEETKKATLRFSQNFVEIEEEEFSKKSVDFEENS